MLALTNIRTSSDTIFSPFVGNLGLIFHPSELIFHSLSVTSSWFLIFRIQFFHVSLAILHQFLPLRTQFYTFGGKAGLVLSLWN